MSVLDAPVNIQNPIFTPLKAARVSNESISQAYSSGALNFTPAATPTDIAALTTAFEGRVCYLKRVSISGTCTSGGAAIDVLLQRSPNAGGGTSAAQFTGRHDGLDTVPTGALLIFSANRTSNGNGVSSSRPLIRAGKLKLGTTAAPELPLVWDFSTRNSKGLAIRSLVEWLVVNLNGQTMPAGTLLTLDVEWTEDRLRRIIMSGDSTTSNANFLFQYLENQPKINSQHDLRNYGSNGFRITDFINNTNAVTWPMSAALGAIPESYAPVEDKMVVCYGINDVRTGATSQAQLISMIDAVIYATLNGTTSGGTYTSPLGAGTTFTWPSTMAAVPDAKIILWGPNSFTSDDPGATGFVTSTGLFNGMTLAQAAQAATDILYNAYASFSGDSRIQALVQKQDLPAFGRTCKTNSASGVMTDILHPNARGQKLEGQQILPYLLA